MAAEKWFNAPIVAIFHAVSYHLPQSGDGELPPPDQLSPNEFEPTSPSANEFHSDTYYEGTSFLPFSWWSRSQFESGDCLGIFMKIHGVLFDCSLLLATFYETKSGQITPNHFP